MTRIAFDVYGTPIAQGSKRHVGKGIMVESSKHLKPWRALVTSEARDAMGDRRPLTGPLLLNVVFRFQRPKKHYRTGKQGHLLREDAPTFHTSAPDTDKLIRSINDAMADAGVMLNDSHVAVVHARKVYDHEQLPGAYIVVEMLDSYFPPSPLA